MKSDFEDIDKVFLRKFKFSDMADMCQSPLLLSEGLVELKNNCSMQQKINSRIIHSRCLKILILSAM